MKNNFHAGLGLEGDGIRLRLGWDGSEPERVTKRFKRLHPHAKRLALAINTWYPAIAGGFYLNRAVVAQVQATLRGLDVEIVADEYFKPGFVLPVEMDGTLLVQEDYLLLTENGIAGTLLLWSFDSGGGNTFYRDSMIMDFAFTSEAMKRVKEFLSDELHAVGIPVESFPDASAT